MERRANTHHIECDKILFRYIWRYHEMLGGVQSLWVMPAGTTPTNNLDHLDLCPCSRVYGQSYALYTISEAIAHLSLTCHVMKTGETGYLGSSLPESKIHGYFSNLFHILVALHYSFLNHLQSSVSDQIWRTYTPWSNKVTRLKLPTSKMIVIFLNFYIFE